jgi:hypothetical protein
VPRHLLAFVTGLHRSGTTLLASSLGQHPDVSGLSGTGAKQDEGQHLQDVVPPARVFGGAGRFALDPRAHLTEDSPLASPENAERLFGQWAPYWDLGRSVLVEKSPPTIVRTRFFQALFPDARFVVSVRHPAVAVLSTRKWRRGVGLATLVEHWLAAHETLLADLSHVRAAHVVKYEHLVAQPEATLGKVGAFLGLSSPVPADAVRADRSDVYVEAWGRLARSRLPWRRAEHRALLAAYEDRVRRFGYSLGDLTVAEPFWEGGRA